MRKNRQWEKRGQESCKCSFAEVKEGLWPAGPEQPVDGTCTLAPGAQRRLGRQCSYAVVGPSRCLPVVTAAPSAPKGCWRGGGLGCGVTGAARAFAQTGRSGRLRPERCQPGYKESSQRGLLCGTWALEVLAQEPPSEPAHSNPCSYIQPLLLAFLWVAVEREWTAQTQHTFGNAFKMKDRPAQIDQRTWR